MPDYRRVFCPGGTFFFTVNLLQRRENDLLVRHVENLRDVVREVRRAHLSRVRRARGERGIWQRRFWEHLIRD